MKNFYFFFFFIGGFFSPVFFFLEVFAIDDACMYLDTVGSAHAKISFVYSTVPKKIV